MAESKHVKAGRAWYKAKLKSSKGSFYTNAGVSGYLQKLGLQDANKISWWDYSEPARSKSKARAEMAETVAAEFLAGVDAAQEESRNKNTGEKQMAKSNGEWVPCHAYRKLADGTVQVLTEADGAREANTGRRKRTPNVAQGFFANGVFHPIRASWDYDSTRAGENALQKAKKTPLKRKTRATAKKTKPALKIKRRKVYQGD